jgi:hypothetical protein
MMTERDLDIVRRLNLIVGDDGKRQDRLRDFSFWRCLVRVLAWSHGFGTNTNGLAV